MLHSRDRVLTTHVGSLPRNEKLSDLLVRREDGEAIDPAQLSAEMDKAVAHVVEHFAYHAGQIIYITKLRFGRDLGFTRLPGERKKRGRPGGLSQV